MGNSLACAAANASLTLFETEPRLDQVAAIEVRLIDALRECRNLRGVAEVRVKGAIGVVQLDRLPDCHDLRAQLLAKGVWVRPFNDVIYVRPPFTIESAELETLLEAVCAVVGSWSRALR
jgi:adenosylmethionine-8-amino-7-oxononanoate aminotransferase